MEQQPTTSARVALKFGLIAGVLLMIHSICIIITEQYMNSWLSWPVQLIVISVVAYMAMKEYKEANGGYLSYGQGLGIGTLLGAVAGVLLSIYSYIYSEFIDPTLRDKIMGKVREQFEQQGMDDDKIDQVMEMSQKWSSPGLSFVFGVLGMIIFGFIVSLVIAAIQKNDKPAFD